MCIYFCTYITFLNQQSWIFKSRCHCRSRESLEDHRHRSFSAAGDSRHRQWYRELKIQQRSMIFMSFHLCSSFINLQTFFAILDNLCQMACITSAYCNISFQKIHLSKKRRDVLRFCNQTRNSAKI